MAPTGDLQETQDSRGRFPVTMDYAWKVPNFSEVPGDAWGGLDCPGLAAISACLTSGGKADPGSQPTRGAKIMKNVIF